MKFKSFQLEHYNQRPADLKIDTVVIHSMYAKGQRNNKDHLSCFKVLDQNKVSAHYSIDRYGCIWKHVNEEMRAWHAGESSLPADARQPGRKNLNDFSIGIEIIGVWGQRFKACQYKALNSLLKDILTRHPIQNIVSHSAIAPGRKIDPGPSFRWDKVKSGLNKFSRKSFRILT